MLFVQFIKKNNWMTINAGHGKFVLTSEFVPTGDQPDAIAQLSEGIRSGETHQVLLGVTGSGKTFTIANVIQNLQMPALVISHNKTLAAQLYSEFRAFFPENNVEYFVSYYDYYQPEAYLPTTNLYIEKDLSINEEIEKFRLSATSALLSGRRDVIVVSSVSCIYGIGNPHEFSDHILQFTVGDKIRREEILEQLVEILYSRSDQDMKFGTFRVKGDIIEIFPSFGNQRLRIYMFGNEIEMIESYDAITNRLIEEKQSVMIYPASIFMTNASVLKEVIGEIRYDLDKQVEFMLKTGKDDESRRLFERVTYDLEMLEELGYCSGIENYSRYFDKRKPGERPYCLIDYFPDDYLMIIDESHVSVPQIRGMYGGDRSRKQILVDYGFRLPAAMDNRPLKFDEFEMIAGQTIYVSATPGDYELQKTGGVFVEQVIRPTGLPEPEVFIRPVSNQVDDLLHEIKINKERDERTLVTTLTKKMAEELSKYFLNLNIKAKYIHADVDTVERVAILSELREGAIDVLVGVNLLREGLDLPEVSLVAILDADKEGFLRSEKSLIQTAGRAARNINSRVIMYADKMTGSMQRMLDETNRRRTKQQEYNLKNNIVPSSITKAHRQTISLKSSQKSGRLRYQYDEENSLSLAADPLIAYLNHDQLKKLIKETDKKMKEAAKELDFIKAAMYRDEIEILRKKLKS
jgi:excinuclease ABC subunit B